MWGSMRSKGEHGVEVGDPAFPYVPPRAHGLSGSRHWALWLADGKDFLNPLKSAVNAYQGYPFFAVQDFHSSSVSLAAHLLRADYEGVTGVNQRKEVVASIVGVHACLQNASFARAA